MTKIIINNYFNDCSETIVNTYYALDYMNKIHINVK